MEGKKSVNRNKTRPDRADRPTYKELKSILQICSELKEKE
jgi:hypothetical protein